MLSHSEYVALQRGRLVDTATSLLEGQLDLIEACRTIAALSGQIDPTAEEEEVLTFFEAVACETEPYPLDAQRELYNPKFLAELDEQKNNYLDRVRDDVYRSCREVIEKIPR